jgi:hypothetical protein
LSQPLLTRAHLIHLTSSLGHAQPAPRPHRVGAPSPLYPSSPSLAPLSCCRTFHQGNRVLGIPEARVASTRASPPADLVTAAPRILRLGSAYRSSKPPPRLSPLSSPALRPPPCPPAVNPACPLPRFSDCGKVEETLRLRLGPRTWWKQKRTRQHGSSPSMCCLSPSPATERLCVPRPLYLRCSRALRLLRASRE